MFLGGDPEPTIARKWATDLMGGPGYWGDPHTFRCGVPHGSQRVGRHRLKLSRGDFGYHGGYHIGLQNGDHSLAIGLAFFDPGYPLETA